MTGAGDLDALQRRIGSVIAAYDAQGWHRTGSDVDTENAGWLAGQVQDAGGIPRPQPFGLLRLDPAEAFVELSGPPARRLHGMPAFDGGLTGAAGIAGALGPLGSGAAIGVTLGELPGQAGAPQAVTVAAARRAGAHQAIVAVAAGSRPGLAPWNAPHFEAPFGPPVLQVSEIPDWLRRAAAAGAGARLVATASRVPAQSANVVARVAGVRPDPPAVVVLTPRSGWWWCAAERGGGIACWLEVLRALHATPPERDVLLVATGGHELGHLGLHAFLAEHPALATTATWLHLGSDIGAAVEPAVRLVASDATLAQRAAETFSAQGAPPDLVRHGAPPGEARAIFDRGGRFISLTGASAHFHLESDRWPQAVDVASVARQARALCAIAARLAG